MLRRSKLFRIISIIIILVFTHEQIGWVQEGQPVWSDLKSFYNLQTQSNSNHIDISYNAGKVNEILLNGGKDTIINIQDAHASLSAQYSITQIIDELVANYDVKLIALEGAEGYLNTSLIKAIPDKDARERIAGELLAEGRMSAGEFFTIISDEDDIALYGVENEELYNKNVESFRKIVEERAFYVSQVDNLLFQLEELSKKVYSSGLKALEDASKLHKEGGIGFSDYWGTIEKIAAKKGISTEKYTNITRLIQTIKAEKEINFIKANNERKRLIDELSGTLNKKDLEILVLESIQFKQNKISQADFHWHLINLASSYGLNADGYEDLAKFVKYVSSYEQIDIFSLYKEISGLEENIRSKLYRNNDERRLSEWIRFAGLLKGLYSAELDNDGYLSLTVQRDEFNSEKCAEFIKGTCRKYVVSIEEGYDLGNIFKGISKALEFYRIAESRDSAMLSNTLRRMHEEGKHVAVLVTGGYHSKGLAKLMRENKLSYLIVSPKFEDNTERPYIAILTNKKKPYQKLLETGKYQLAAQPYSGDIGEEDLLDLAFRWLPGKEARDMGSWSREAETWLDGYAKQYFADEKISPEKIANTIHPAKAARILGVKEYRGRGQLERIRLKKMRLEDGYVVEDGSFLMVRTKDGNVTYFVSKPGDSGKMESPQGSPLRRGYEEISSSQGREILERIERIRGKERGSEKNVPEQDKGSGLERGTAAEGGEEEISSTNLGSTNSYDPETHQEINRIIQQAAKREIWGEGIAQNKYTSSDLGLTNMLIELYGKDLYTELPSDISVILIESKSLTDPNFILVDPAQDKWVFSHAGARFDPKTKKPRGKYIYLSEKAFRSLAMSSSENDKKFLRKLIHDEKRHATTKYDKEQELGKRVAIRDSHKANDTMRRFVETRFKPGQPVQQKQKPVQQKPVGEEKVQIECPHCEKKLSVKKELLGQQAECPVCHEPFVLGEQKVPETKGEDAALTRIREDEAQDQQFVEAAVQKPAAPEKININCPHCDKLLRIKSSDIGKNFTCPGCKKQFEASVGFTETIVRDPDATMADETPASERHLKETPGGTILDKYRRTTSKHVQSIGQLGQYELVQKLGEGGMGVVYKAYDPKLDRYVALKLMKNLENASEKDIARFIEEAQSVAKLTHPGIVQIYDFGTLRDNGNEYPYFTMEYVEGTTLDKLMENKELESKEQVLNIIVDVLEALEYAHSKGIIHRDIKPSNILIDKKGQIKIMDFGLAKNIESSVKLTQTGSAMGTPSYMPPEQARGNDPTRRNDIYSTGAMLYEMFASHPPFVGKEVMEVLNKILHEEPVPVKKRRSRIYRGIRKDEDLNTIIMKMIEKFPEDRYQTAQEAAEDIQRYLAGREIKARPLSRGEKFKRYLKRNKKLFIPGLILFIAVIIAGISTFIYIKKETEEAKQKELALQEEQKRLEEEKRKTAEEAEKERQRIAEERKKLEEEARIKRLQLEGKIEDFIKDKKYDEAITECKKIIMAYPGTDFAVYAAYNMGLAYLEIGSEQDAIDTFKKLSQDHPGEEFAPHALLHLAKIYYKQKNVEEALKCADLIEEKYKDNNEVRKELSMFYEKIAFEFSYNNNLSDAIRIAKKYLEYPPEDLYEVNRMKAYMGWWMSNNFELDEAKKVFKEVLDDKEKYPRSENNDQICKWGNIEILALRGRYQECIDEYNKITDVNVKDHHAIVMAVSISYFIMGDYEKAVELLEKRKSGESKWLIETYIVSNSFLLNCYRKFNRVEDIQERMKKIREALEKSDTFIFWKIYSDKGVIEDRKKAIEMIKGNPRRASFSCYICAERYYSEGKKEEAAHFLLRYLEFKTGKGWLYPLVEEMLEDCLKDKVIREKYKSRIEKLKADHPDLFAGIFSLGGLVALGALSAEEEKKKIQSNKRKFNNAVKNLKSSDEKKKIKGARALKALGMPEAISELIKALSDVNINNKIKIEIIEALAELKRVPLPKKDAEKSPSSIMGIINKRLEKYGLRKKSRIIGPYHEIKIELDPEDLPIGIEDLKNEIGKDFKKAGVVVEMSHSSNMIGVKIDPYSENLTKFWRALGSLDFRFTKDGKYYRPFTMYEIVEKVEKRADMFLDGLEIELLEMESNGVMDKDPDLYEEKYNEYRDLKFFVYGDGTETNPGLINIIKHPDQLRPLSDKEYKWYKRTHYGVDSMITMIDGEKYISYGNSPIIRTESIERTVVEDSGEKWKMTPLCSFNDIVRVTRSNPYFTHFMENIEKDWYLRSYVAKRADGSFYRTYYFNPEGEYASKTVKEVKGIKKWVYLARAAGSVFQTAFIMDQIRGEEKSNHEMFFISRDTLGDYYEYRHFVISSLKEIREEEDKYEGIYPELEKKVLEDLDQKYTSGEERWREVLDGIWWQLKTSGILNGVKYGEHISVVDEIAVGTYDYMFKYIVEKKSLEESIKKREDSIQFRMDKYKESREEAEAKVKAVVAPIYVDIFIGDARENLREYPVLQQDIIERDYGMVSERARRIKTAVSKLADFQPHPVMVHHNAKIPATKNRFRIRLEESDVLVSSFLNALLGINGLLEYHDLIVFYPLEKLLKEDPSPEIRKAAALALSKVDVEIFEEKAKEVLNEIAGTEEDKSVLEAASRSVSDIIERQVARNIEESKEQNKEEVKAEVKGLYKSIPIFMQAAKSPYSEVRRLVLKRLAELHEDFFYDADKSLTLEEQIAGLLHESSVLRKISENDFDEGIEDIVKEVENSYQTNLNEGRVTIIGLFGGRDVGKEYVSNCIAHKLKEKMGDSVKVNRISMESGWLLDHSRRETPLGISGKFGFKGTLGFRSFIHNLRNGRGGHDELFMPFYVPEESKRIRIIDTIGSNAYLDGSGKVKEKELTEAIRKLVDDLKKNGARVIRVKETLLLQQLFDEEGNWLVKDKALKEQVVQRIKDIEKYSDRKFDRKNLYVDITERKNGTFITGDFVEKIIPNKKDVYIITGRLFGSNEAFLEGEREKLFDSLVAVWTRSQMRKVKLMRRLRTNRITRSMSENDREKFYNDMILEETNEIQPSFLNAEKVLLSVSDFEDFLFFEVRREIEFPEGIELSDDLFADIYLLFVDSFSRSETVDLFKKKKEALREIISSYGSVIDGETVTEKDVLERLKKEIYSTDQDKAEILNKTLREGLEEDPGEENHAVMLFKMGIPEELRLRIVRYLEEKGFDVGRVGKKIGPIGMDEVLKRWGAGSGLEYSVNDIEKEGIDVKDAREALETGNGEKFYTWFMKVDKEHPDLESVRLLKYSIECLNRGVEMVILRSRVSRRQLVRDFGADSEYPDDEKLESIPFQDIFKRVVVGATKAFEAAPGTLRGDFIKLALQRGAEMEGLYNLGKALVAHEKIGLIANGIHCPKYDELPKEINDYIHQKESIGIVIGVIGVSQERIDEEMLKSNIGGIKGVALSAGSEEENLEKLEAFRREYGAYTAGLIQGAEGDFQEVLHEFITDIEEKDKAKFISEFNRSPEMTSLSGKSMGEIQQVLDIISNRFAVLRSLRSSDLKVYEYKFDRIAEMNRLQAKDAENLQAKLSKLEGTKIATFRVKDINGLRWLANEHRKAIDDYRKLGKGEYPVKLHIRIAGELRERLEGEDITKDNIDGILKLAGVDDVISKDDISFRDSDSVSKIYTLINEKYGAEAKDIAIGDTRDLMLQNDEKGMHLLNEDKMLFVKMEKGLESQLYNVIISLMVNDNKIPEFMNKNAVLEKDILGYYIFRIKPIAIDEELEAERMSYEAALISM